MTRFVSMLRFGISSGGIKKNPNMHLCIAAEMINLTPTNQQAQLIPLTPSLDAAQPTTSPYLVIHYHRAAS